MAEVEGDLEVADTSDTTVGIACQHGGSGRQSYSYGR
jgi:hypothetical protein